MPGEQPGQWEESYTAVEHWMSVLRDRELREREAVFQNDIWQTISVNELANANTSVSLITFCVNSQILL